MIDEILHSLLGFTGNNISVILLGMQSYLNPSPTFKENLSVLDRKKCEELFRFGVQYSALQDFCDFYCFQVSFCSLNASHYLLAFCASLDSQVLQSYR
jgi:hypothetical protein